MDLRLCTLASLCHQGPGLCEITTSSAGASLDISGCARPLLLGRFAFCDNPNSTNQGCLGDRTYENGETLCDVIVAASSSYGRGKVLVFGDISYIFNAEMPFRYGMIYDAVAWLSSKDQSFGPALAWLSLTILVALAGFIVLVRPRQDLRVSFMASAAVILALSLAVSGSINESWIQSAPRRRGGHGLDRCGSLEPVQHGQLQRRRHSRSLPTSLEMAIYPWSWGARRIFPRYPRARLSSS